MVVYQYLWLTVTSFVGILPKYVVGVLPIVCEVYYLGGWCTTTEAEVYYLGGGVLPLKLRCTAWGVVYYH